MTVEQEKKEKTLYLSEITNIDLENSGIFILQVVKDYPDGNLYIAEAQKDTPFEIKRVYWINNFTRPDAQRGKHAHRNLQQAIFCTQGCFTLLLSDGVKKISIVMDTPNKGVYLGPLLWHDMTHFSKNCQILVLASDHYNEADYIRDYNEFLKLTLKHVK